MTYHFCALILRSHRCRQGCAREPRRLAYGAVWVRLRHVGRSLPIFVESRSPERWCQARRFASRMARLQVCCRSKLSTAAAGGHASIAAYANLRHSHPLDRRARQTHSRHRSPRGLCEAPGQTPKECGGSSRSGSERRSGEAKAPQIHGSPAGRLRCEDAILLGETEEEGLRPWPYFLG
jgi:hypothetical protein